jgi:NDP-sugar pyrophosphorylase family protein
MTKTILITTSGIGERLGTITKYTNKSLVKVGDKYAICYIIELYNEPDTEFIITLGYYGNYVKDFLLLAYPNKKFTFVDIDLFVGIGSSLGYSMLKAKDFLQKPFIFHCCDSIILDKIIFEENKNCLYVYPYKNSNNYTNIKCKNNIITEINNKKHTDFDYIYTGVSYIYDYQLFWNYLQGLYEKDKNNSSLNDVDSITLMFKNGTLFNYSILEKWYDTGNLDSYEIIKNEFKPNYNVIEKNNESICFLNNKVIKFINDVNINKKRLIRGEYLYPLSPKILGNTDNFISMELIDGQIMSNFYDNKIIYKLLTWSKDNLWNEQAVNPSYIDCCKRFYITKTLDRLSKINFLENEKNIINGLKCENIVKFIKELPENLLVNDTFTKIHGDFILDNIIKTTDSFKLIDWRHEFDKELYYGDIYYDLAKLRHNIIFNHSNILNDLFTIEYKNDEVIVDLKCNYFLIQQLNDFDQFVKENNYDINKIKIITSIIWLNMSPLYDGKLSEFLFYLGKYNLFMMF